MCELDCEYTGWDRILSGLPPSAIPGTDTRVLPAAYLNRKAGRKFTMAAAGVMFEIGGILLAAAANYEMLVIGRCFLGVAVSPGAPFLSKAALQCL